MLSVTAPSKMLLATVLVGAGLVPCGLAALALRAFSPASVVTESTLCGCEAAPQNLNYGSEVGLQETLDRLGYTVNVPTEYGRHKLKRWNDYRLSTTSDALPASRFQVGKSARFTKVSEQAMLAGSTDFGVADTQGGRHSVFPPDHNQNTFWISSEAGAARSWPSIRSTRFYLNETSHMLSPGVLSSVPQANADHTPHLLTLPALKGGQWIDEGSNTGHWQGGMDTGALLLCWEDWQDYDYQDMVILAQNVVPDNNKTDTYGKNEIAAVSR